MSDCLKLELTRAEAITLIDALKAWESKPADDLLVKTLLESLANPLVFLNREKFTADIEAKAKTAGEKNTERAESILFLKGKLVQLRNRLSEHQDTAEKIGGGVNAL